MASNLYGREITFLLGNFLALFLATYILSQVVLYVPLSPYLFGIRAIPTPRGREEEGVRITIYRFDTREPYLHFSHYFTLSQLLSLYLLSLVSNITYFGHSLISIIRVNLVVVCFLSFQNKYLLCCPQFFTTNIYSLHPQNTKNILHFIESFSFIFRTNTSVFIVQKLLKYVSLRFCFFKCVQSYKSLAQLNISPTLTTTFLCKYDYL